MRCKQLSCGLLAGLGMLILILDGQTALDGGRAGIDLCIKTVIPSLFPFFVLSNILANMVAGERLSLLRPLGSLCKIPEGSEFILLSGFLGGYPVGAQCIHTAYQAGQISKEDAQRMLGFCCNAGPAFLFGMVASLFPHSAFGWALWGIHIISAVLVAVLIPGQVSEWKCKTKKVPISFTVALHNTLRVMATVCGWIILFRIVIVFLKRWILWVFPVSLQTFLIGLLELSNGCFELPAVANVELRFTLCSGILAFGGLCVTMQTISVTKELSLRYYFLGKLLQTLFSISICAGILSKSWHWFFGLLLISSVCLRSRKKRVAITV